MEFLNDIISYGYLRNAIIAAILSGVICGVVGCYIVAKRSLFLAGGITHSSFGGLGIALFCGFNPILGASLFAVGSSVACEWASSRARLREDSAIGIIWALGMATGALFMSLRPGYNSGDLASYLFGSIITVTDGDVVALAVMCVVVVVGALLWLRPIMLIAFDRDYSRSQGLHTSFVSYAMAVVTALAIVLSIRIMGIVLLISMLSLPVVIADMFSRSYRRMVVLAPIIAVLSNVIGLYLSYQFDIPPSATIIFLLSTLFAAVKVVRLF
ncbi:MAG: metal ABC transporter permease [Rikenellaceae bacterium]